MHLGGPELGGLSYDIREPKPPFADRFMLAGGHCIPTCYALWMILYEAMARRYTTTGDDRYACDPEIAILSVDALGFRRSEGAMAKILDENDLAEHPLFAQAKLRGIRPLMGHAESTDVTNDVNGGPSGIGIATAAGKAMFWAFIGAPSSLKVIALEGEFAMTEGHAQELKTAAVAQQVGKRLLLGVVTQSHLLLLAALGRAVVRHGRLLLLRHRRRHLLRLAHQPEQLRPQRLHRMA